MKYRKKPVVIEAIQWTGENVDEVNTFVENECFFSTESGESYMDVALTIFTLEGFMKASVGDYIIKGVQGEFYPCKPDIFEATYEAV